MRPQIQSLQFYTLNLVYTERVGIVTRKYLWITIVSKM